MKEKRYIITGGCGFIGSALVYYLLDNELCSELLVVDDLSTGSVDNLPKHKNVKLLIEKFQNVDEKIIDKNYDGIFHLAAQASVPISIDHFYSSSKNNLISTLRVFDIARMLKIPIVYASSSAVYGNLPIGNEADETVEILSPYAQDKLTMEHYAKVCWDNYKIPSAGFRLFNVYGPRQDPSNPYSGVISIFIDRLIKKMPVVVNGGYQTRDFIFVDDAVRVMNQAMYSLEDQKGALIFNIGTGVSTSINNLLAICVDIIGFTPKIIKKPLHQSDPERSAGTYDKMQLLLKIDLKEFLQLRDGLVNTIDYFKALN